MKIKEFEAKYGKQGGIEKLTQLRALLFSQDFIAEHFGVSKERIRQWMKEFFGSTYDKRKDRKDIMIIGMIDFAKKNTKEDFEEAYKYSVYYEEALKQIKKHDIKRWRN